MRVTDPCNILPWTDTTATTGGKIEYAFGITICTPGMEYCAPSGMGVRVYPPDNNNPGQGYTSLVQDVVVARPLTTYSISFLYRCQAFDGSSGIDVYYRGSRVGGATCGNVSAPWFQRVTSGIQFTTDETGVGSLEIRFLNPSGMNHAYYYAADFMATAIN